MGKKGYARAGRKGKTRFDLYQAVTDNIITVMEEQGEIPWKKPWKGMSIPRNLSSSKPYRGINVALLWGAGVAKGYDTGYWMTFNQAKAKGGVVRKGEKSTMVVFWKILKVADTEREGKEKSVPFLRYYNVFNVDQIEGIEAPDKGTSQHDPVAEAEEIIKGMPSAPEVRVGGDRASYSMLKDLVRMPPMERFDSIEEYYSAYFHELVHSTSHPSRLDRGRGEDHRFGSEDYSEEELVAELGASFLLATVGIESPAIPNKAAYIANWLKVFEGDKKILVRAGGKAQKAVDYILGERGGNKEERVDEKE